MLKPESPHYPFPSGGGGWGGAPGMKKYSHLVLKVQSLRGFTNLSLERISVTTSCVYIYAWPADRNSAVSAPFGSFCFVCSQYYLLT